VEDTVCLNMNDLTDESLIKIYKIVRNDSEDQENIDSVKKIQRYLREDRGV